MTDPSVAVHRRAVLFPGQGSQFVGMAADLVVFDPDTVADTATFESPHSYPVGISHVAVNGVLAVENGDFTGATPGTVVRDFND